MSAMLELSRIQIPSAQQDEIPGSVTAVVSIVNKLVAQAIPTQRRAVCGACQDMGVLIDSATLQRRGNELLCGASKANSMMLSCACRGRSDRFGLFCVGVDVRAYCITIALKLC